MLGNILKDNKGVTLIEIIISIAILAVIIPPMSNMFLTAARFNRESEDLLKAANNAQQIIEQRRAGLVNIDSMDDYSYDLQESSDLEGYSVSEDVPNYHGVIELEKNSDGKVSFYKLSEDTRMLVESYDNVNNNMRYNIEVYSNQIEITSEDINFQNIYIPYTKSPNDPVKIGVECHGDIDLELAISNHLSEGGDVYVYASNVIDGEYQSSSEIDVEKVEGTVKTRLVSNQKKSDYDKDKKLLKKLEVKVSRGSTYSEKDMLVEIRTLKKE